MTMLNEALPQPAPIYQCHEDVHRTVRSVRDHLHGLCSHHVNRLVKVETLDGDVFEGHIIRCDKSILYLSLSNEGSARAFLPFPFFNPYSRFILPLVLYDLLAITLLL